MMIRPNFIVHWTGKDIGPCRSELNPSERGQYIGRLADILENGFWMTKPREEVLGGHPLSPGGSVSMAYETYMTCFTELRLSQSREHANKYGCLGVGVDRKFILDRFGSPVHYVRNHKEEIIWGYFQRLLYLIRRWRSGNGQEAIEAVKYIEYLGLYLKPMSNLSKDDFIYLDENEWRIVFTKEKLIEGLIKDTSIGNPQYRIPLDPKDLKIIVFPDEETRTLATQDSKLMALAFSANSHPILLTIDDCQQF